MIKREELKYFGYVIRNDKYRLFQIRVQGSGYNKRRGPSRRRISWLKNLHK